MSVRCPHCGSPMHVERTETEVPVFCPNPGGLPYIEQRRAPAVVGFCSGCEFVHEIGAEFLRGAR